MSKVVRVYDPNRNPPEWNELLHASQVAVFVEDAHHELPLGGPDPTCEIFDDLHEAETHCKQLTERDPTLRCLVFDRNGRGGNPLAVYESARFRTWELTTRFRRWSATLLMTAAIVLIWLDWRSDFERMWPSVLAWKFVTIALVFIVWEAVLIVQRRTRRS